MNKRSWLDIAEYLSVAGSVVGSGVAVASQQTVLFAAAAPISLSLILNLANRRRLQLSQPAAATEIVQLKQQMTDELAALRERIQGMPDDTELNQVLASVAKLSEELARVQHQVQNAQSLVQGVELNPIRQDLSVLREHCTTFQDALAQLGRRLDRVEGEGGVAVAPAKVERLESAIAQVQGKIAQVQAKLQKLDSVPENGDRAALSAQLEQLERRLQSIESTSGGSFEQQLDELRAGFEQLRDRAPQESGGDLSALDAQIEDLQRQQGELDRRLAPLLAVAPQIEAISQQWERQPERAQIEELRSSLADALGAIADINERLERGEFAVPAGDESDEAAFSEIEDLQGVDRALAKISESVGEVLDEMNRRLSPLEAVDLAAVREQLSGQGAAIAELREQCVQLRQSLAVVDDTLEDWAIDLSPATLDRMETAIVHIQERLMAPSGATPEEGETTPTAVVSEARIEQLQQELSQVAEAVAALEMATQSLAPKQEVYEKLAELRALSVEVREGTQKALGNGGRPVVEEVHTLREHLETLARSLPNPQHLQALESEIGEIAQKFDSRPELDQIQGLMQSISEVHQRLEIATLERGSDPDGDPPERGGIDAALESLSVSVAAVEARLNQLQGESFSGEQLDPMRSQIAELHSTVAQLSDRVETLSANSPGRVDRLEGALVQVQAKLDELAKGRDRAAVQGQIEHLSREILMLARNEGAAIAAGDDLDVQQLIAESIERHVGEINQRLQAIQPYRYQLAFDRPNIRAILEEALDTARDRLILVCPWVSRASLDASLLQKFEAALDRGVKICIGWGHLRDIDRGEFPVHVNQQWQSDPTDKRGLYDALNDLEALRRRYPEQFELKILGTHENFLVCDGSSEGSDKPQGFALLASDHFLSASAELPEREVGLKTTDPEILAGLVERFYEPILAPGNPQAYYNRGFERLDMGDYRGAVEDYTEALELDPQQATAYNNRGLAHFHLGELDGAIADYSASLELNPNESVVYFNRGFAYFNRGDYEAAIADYNNALRLAPEVTGAYFYRGEAYNQLGEHQRAIADYSEAIRLAPTDAVAYNNRGLARYNQGDYPGAIDDYTQAIRLNPDDAVAYSNRGVARSAISDYRAAIEDFDRALSVHPDYAGAYNNRGLARSEIGDLQGAIADLQRAAELFATQGDRSNERQALEALHKLRSTNN
ncbi:tetratricopeptide repeat protein [Oxynema aestuarii]|uniref:Tetratricopeptide repeat protein n=1 Tax=Oxynema aestuarii AP17 TaxID=2064643 RepID=A0A6H1U499_9CYAN|nr:tetratricopeptide repeat protein [Oxynema aestuarii]QIZ72449.1 tetratricopeptide repeat protein [Oxynema aestuarii AP17]